MGMNRTIRLASIVFTTWLMVIFALMLLRQMFDLEIFIVLAIIGLLVVVVLIDTSSVPPIYLRWMKLIVITAMLIFGIIVANRIVQIFTQ